MNFAAILTALARGAGGEPGRRAWKSLVRLDARAQDTHDPEQGQALNQALSERAVTDAAFREELTAWWRHLQQVLTDDLAAAGSVADAAEVYAPGAGSWYRGDHVDFGQALVMGDAVAKKEENHYYSPHVPVPTALHAVPAAPAGFTGRTDELDLLLAALDPAAHCCVTAVAGLGGVGKTALALHTAHAARERGWFPGGTLFIDLHGYDPVATTASQALQALLRALGTAPERIPTAAEDQAALFRSTLADLAQARGPALILLDNASSPQQVRPLLAGHPAHRTLITSRDVLPQIGAQQVRLRQLTPESSKDLLDHALSTADPYDRRITEDSAASEQLACTCGGLPLALQICAALLIADPGKPVAELAEELADAGRRIDHLDDGERSVRAVFDLSYRRLPQEQARLFRILAISPGTEVTLNAISALADTADPPQHLLDALARTHLVERGTTRSHWRMHDLVRVYAQTVVEGDAGLRREAFFFFFFFFFSFANAADPSGRAITGVHEAALTTG